MLVILWTDSWTRAWACSCSMNWEISCWSGCESRWGSGRGERAPLSRRRTCPWRHVRLGGSTSRRRMTRAVGKSLRRSLVHRAHHSHLMDTVRASLVFLISLFSFSNPPPLPPPPWPPPPHGPQTSPSTHPTPTSGSQTSAPRTSPPPSVNPEPDRTRLPFRFSVPPSMSPGRRSP